ncbi:MAG TPA: acyl carrier protein, partial [Planctomycetaceae bacterium]|nr:acyl carrier protein [Planctomycetaceae bacterium]
GLNEIKTRMPFIDLSKFEEDPVVQDFGNLLTVSDLCRYISGKVGAAD